MDIARKIGVNSENLSTEIFLSEDEKREVEIIRSKFLNGKKYLIGIHTTSGNSAPNWPAEKYRELILELQKEKDIQIVVTDNNVPKELSNLENILFPNVGLPLRKSFINFSALDLLISASTGPMHIAAALKTKTLSMFCPMTACSPKLWGPMGNESKIILPEENYCKTVCPGDPKKCTFEGDGGIVIEKIISSLKEILN